MQTIANLRDLLLTQIFDLYNAELLQIRILPELCAKVTNSALKTAIERHTEETHSQIHRLNRVLRAMKETPVEEDSKGLICLAAQAVDLCDRCSNQQVLDAAIITAVQHINHFEIAGYGASCAYANALGASELAAVLHDILVEEQSMNARLSDIARHEVNIKAIETSSGTQTHPLALSRYSDAY